MFNWLFYWKYFLLFLSINCCIRFKLPNNFPVFAENEEKKIICHLFKAVLPYDLAGAEFQSITPWL